MSISYDPASSVPPFEQVRTSLANQINDGILAVGTKLPTVRGLAAELGIAPNTVARAYRELEEAGLLETRGRAGTFVSATGDETLSRAQAAATTYAEVIRGLGLSAEQGVAIAAAALR